MKDFLSKAQNHLHVLCSDISNRSVGSAGNRMATNYVKRIFTEFGWEVEETLLPVMDWKTDGATLCCNNEKFEVFSSPYSLGCQVQGELIAIATVEELQIADVTNKIVLLHSSLAAEQIAPKNFVFYNPEEHQKIIALLEQKHPKALVCATKQNPAFAGGVYPFPLFEDGDFDIPSVYMKDTEGEKLLAYIGKNASLESKAIRTPETAYNIVAIRNSNAHKRIVITAHVDTKIGTPGAIDNGTGVIVLLLLAEMLKEYNWEYAVELVAFNGEDYYAVPGQMKYLEQNKNKFDNIMLNINIDGVGYHKGLSSFSGMELPQNIQYILNDIIRNNNNIVEGLPWYQGDHSIFLQNGCSAIAVSSDWFIRNFDKQDITHTPKDNLHIVNYEQVVECAKAIQNIMSSLNSNYKDVIL